jgi:hypothetical protein
MDPIEYALELRTRQAGRELADEAQLYLDQIHDGIVSAAGDAADEIAAFLAEVDGQ